MSDWYNISVVKIGRGQLNLNGLTAPTLVALKQGQYTFSQSHSVYTDIPAGAILAETALSGVSFGGAGGNDTSLFANDATFVNPGVATVDSYILYDNAGTKPLICYINSGVGLPITTETGRDLIVQWNGGKVAVL